MCRISISLTTLMVISFLTLTYQDQERKNISNSLNGTEEMELPESSDHSFTTRYEQQGAYVLTKQNYLQTIQKQIQLKMFITNICNISLSLIIFLTICVQLYFNRIIQKELSYMYSWNSYFKYDVVANSRCYLNDMDE